MSSSAHDHEHVSQQNSKGGILIDRKDIKKLFSFLDVNNQKYLTESDLRNRLPIFYKSSLNSSDYKSLMNNKSQLTCDDLYNILVDNEINVNGANSFFDPINESFKIFDPNDTGFLDTNVLKSMFMHLGYNKITDDELQILIQIADIDGDEKINLEDC